MRNGDRERGATLITVALMLAVLISVLALAVDVGVGRVERRRIQAVADAAALAGVQVLVNNLSDQTIVNTVNDYVLVRNPVASGETRTYRIYWMRGETVLGQEVGNGGRPTGVTGIYVQVRGTLPTIFANILPGNITTVSAMADGGGGYSPLDLMLVMDRSGSMEFYSCNWQTYFNAGGACYALVGSGYANEYDRQEQVYNHCGGDPYNYTTCDGVWRRPNLTSPYACYFHAGGLNYTLMTTTPPGCTNISNQSGCQACKAQIVPPYEPITDAQNAANYFIDLVASELGPTEPRIGLISFSNTATTDAHLTAVAQFGSLKSTVNGLAAKVHSTGGGTNCEDGMYRARQELIDRTRVRGTSVKAIVFLTDGNANEYRGCTSYCSDSSPYTTSRNRMKAEARAAQSAGIRVYAIGLGAGVKGLAESDLQQMVVDPTGQYSGTYLYAPTGADLQAAYAAMFAQIKRLRLVE